MSLDPTALLRPTYRALLRSQRAYAAFTESEKALVGALAGRGPILDPMSGYGLITRYCNVQGIDSFCLEYNAPQYLWQLLNLPENSDGFLRSIDRMSGWRNRWPRKRRTAGVSPGSFTDDALEMLDSLLSLWQEAVVGSFRPGPKDQSLLGLAALLPFVGRLACWVPTSNPTQTKPGGMCVFEYWADDYEQYLQRLVETLTPAEPRPPKSRHAICYGDAREYRFPAGKFRAMLTSPPYPNRTDYSSLFAPENEFLKHLSDRKQLPLAPHAIPIIGSNFVSGREQMEPRSKSARRFLGGFATAPGGSQADYNDKAYYFPYFRHYFCDIEKAYANVSRALRRPFRGYVVVVNNTHRNTVVPVAEVIMEVWKGLGFSARIHSSSEAFHIGTKNPRARGIRARHTQFIIEITK